MRFHQIDDVREEKQRDDKHRLFPISETTSQARIYENEVPADAAALLEKLYSSIYCTIARFELYDSLSLTSTYVVSHGDQVRTLILFRILHGRVIEVLNQQIALSAEEIRHFCSFVFARYPLVRRVGFYALDGAISKAELAYPCQIIPQIEEFVVKLPDNIEGFLKAMPYQTRTSVLKNIRRIERDYPSYRFEVLIQNAIESQHISELVRLANERMKSKGLPAYIGDDDVENLAELAKTHGCIGLIRIDGVIRAGTLCFRVGRRYFSRMITHDPSFNAYGLGNQLQLAILRYCIDTGASEFWMMGGATESKRRFLAQRRVLNSIVVYRSPRDVLMSMGQVAENQWKRTYFLCRENLRKAACEAGMPGQLAASLVRGAKAASALCKQTGRFARQLRRRT